MDWTNIPMEDHFEVHEDELRVLNPCLERPAAERVTTVWGGGPQTTRTAYSGTLAGFQRGELEGVIGALADLPARYTDETTIVDEEHAP